MPKKNKQSKRKKSAKDSLEYSIKKLKSRGIDVGFSGPIGEFAGYPVYASHNCPKHDPKKYTDMDLINAANEERQKIFTIINYILNKNSRTLAEGGVDYEKAYNEMQDLEDYLLEDLE